MLDTSRVHDLAHQLWDQQGRPTGHELDHWLEAERRLSEERQADEAMENPKKEKRDKNRKKKKKKG